MHNELIGRRSKIVRRIIHIHKCHIKIFILM